MFGAAGSGSGPDDAQAPPSSPPPAAANPWDLARGAGPLASPPGAGPVSPTPGPGTAPGEFTRMFEPQRNLGMPPASSPGHGSPDFFARSNPPPAPHPAAPPVPSAPPAAQPPGEFTRLMQGVVPAPAPGGVPAAPGDFTRMLAATPLPTPAAPPSAGSAEQAVQRRPRLLVLVIALAFVGITALVLVLYIALK